MPQREFGAGHDPGARQVPSKQKPPQQFVSDMHPAPSGRHVLHAPMTQNSEQTLPQAPQLLASLWRFVHVLPQSAGVPIGHTHTSPSQVPGGEQVIASQVLHAPMTQAPPAGQTWPQAPQLLASLSRLVHSPPQIDDGGRHGVHSVSLHTLGGRQVIGLQLGLQK